MIRYQIDYNYDDRSWIVWKVIFWGGRGKTYSWLASFLTRQMAREYKRILENNMKRNTQKRCSKCFGEGNYQELDDITMNYRYVYCDKCYGNGYINDSVSKNF